ncbi:hypothetical protein F5050DRAFT_1713678 [Lentinula boryana]|uniref:Uncharacterized protein n=1 Tax=Lentinula boryana TaxID=40481 RepID=A0ABQ8Q7K0_9AGAR|nr:hypothetical protein F5050DRAFT_1713678 [Lentinula boryana]
MAQSFPSRSRAEGDESNLPSVGERSTTLTLYPVSSPQSESSLFSSEDDRPGQADNEVKVEDEDDQVAVDRFDGAHRDSQSSSSAQGDRSSSSATSTHTINVRDDPDTHEVKTGSDSPESSFLHTQTLPTCDSMALSSSQTVHCYTDIIVDESSSHSGVHESPNEDDGDGSDTDTEPDVDGPNLVNGFEHTDTEILEDDAGIYNAGSQSSLISVPSQLIRDAMDEILPKSYDVVGLNEDEEAGIERRGSSSELTDAEADGNGGSNKVVALSPQSSYASTTSSSSSDTLAPPSSPTHPDAIPEDVPRPHPQPTDASTPIPQPCPGPTPSVVWREHDIARQLPISRNPRGVNQKFQNSHTSWIPRFLCGQGSEDDSEGVDSRRENVQAGHFLTDSSLADESINSPDSSASTYVEPSPLRRHSSLSPTSSIEVSEECVRHVQNREIVNEHEEGSETGLVETLGSSTGMPTTLDMEAPLASTGTDVNTDETTTTTVTTVSISSNSTLKRKRTKKNWTRARSWHSGMALNSQIPDHEDNMEKQKHSVSSTSTFIPSSSYCASIPASESEMEMPGPPPSKRLRIEDDGALARIAHSRNTKRTGAPSVISSSDTSRSPLLSLTMNSNSDSKKSKRRGMQRYHTAPSLIFGGSGSELSVGSFVPLVSSEFLFSFMGKENTSGGERKQRVVD